MDWKRGQITWGLWNLAVGRRPSSAWTVREIPSAFKRRVIVLIELGVGVEEANRSGQKGIDQTYGLPDAMELALALDLMTFSWPQSEVAAFIVKNRRILRMRIGAVEIEGATRQLMWILPSPYRDPLTGESGSASLIYYVPEFSSETAEEMAQLNKLNSLWRERLVIDVGSMKRSLAAYLTEAPEIRRGRK